MADENKNDLNEQQTFLSGHEELPESINEKKDAPDEPLEKAEQAEEASTDEAVVDEEPSLETDPEPEAETLAAQSLPEIEKQAPAPGLNRLNGKKKKKKMPLQPQGSSQHEEVLKKQALEQQEVKEVLVFLQKYAKPAAIAIIVICAIVLVDKLFKAQRHKKEATADTALMHAQSAEDLQAIVEDYASTPSGPLALMALAREKFNAGQFDEAEILYTRFKKKHGGHELAAQAELNLVTCKEANGQLGDAHLLYGEFVKKHVGSYLVPSAMMGQARCLEALDQLDEAQIAYEDIIVNFPETSWSRVAEANLKTVLGKKK